MNSFASVIRVLAQDLSCRLARLLTASRSSLTNCMGLMPRSGLVDIKKRLRGKSAAHARQPQTSYLHRHSCRLDLCDTTHRVVCLETKIRLNGACQENASRLGPRIQIGRASCRERV